ncbi:MAG: response regulator [Candidatus Neomarinimicrobiota bacterium]
MNKTILLIEDDDYFSSVIKIHLDKQGLDVHIAPDAETGMALLPKINPALILLDVMLPGIDGFAACLKIKSDPQLKKFPVIMLTGKSKIKDIDKAFEVGADDYITKSSAIHILLQTLNAKIEQYST